MIRLSQLLMTAALVSGASLWLARPADAAASFVTSVTADAARTTLTITGGNFCAPYEVSLPALGGGPLAPIAASVSQVTVAHPAGAQGSYLLAVKCGPDFAYYLASLDPEATGATGPTGSDGAIGTTGAAGAQGAMGAAGPPGVTGAAGATGAQGLPGPPGATGPAGSAANVSALAPLVNGSGVFSLPGVVLNASADSSTGLGHRPLATSGAQSVAVGYQALKSPIFGNGNTATGYQVLWANTGGYLLTGMGYQALRPNIASWFNTGIGSQALSSNDLGESDTAAGYRALFANTGGLFNTAVGYAALSAVTADHYNTAVGSESLRNLTAGSDNTALGRFAGSNPTSGSSNIYLGAGVLGTAGDAETIRLGVQGTQTRTLIAGIRGVTTGVANAIPVRIDSNGQLGTISSSRRFKEDIRDMGDVSRTLFLLRPVTFRYSTPYADGARPIQYGLVAEEVAEAFPDLAVHNTGGGVDTVHYETLNVLLLNEVQRQERLMREQDSTEHEQRRVVLDQQARLDAQEAAVRAQWDAIDEIRRRLAAVLETLK